MLTTVQSGLRSFSLIFWSTVLQIQGHPSLYTPIQLDVHTAFDKLYYSVGDITLEFFGLQSLIRPYIPII